MAPIAPSPFVGMKPMIATSAVRTGLCWKLYGTQVGRERERESHTAPGWLPVFRVMSRNSQTNFLSNFKASIGLEALSNSLENIQTQ
jgi:hypothetical protein